VKTYVHIVCIAAVAIDTEILKEQSLEGARMGFTGKQVIHPIQVPIVQDAFSPTPKKVEWATELIKAFEEHQHSGKACTCLLYMLYIYAHHVPKRCYTLSFPYLRQVLTDFPNSSTGTLRGQFENEVVIKYHTTR